MGGSEGHTGGNKFLTILAYTLALERAARRDLSGAITLLPLLDANDERHTLLSSAVKSELGAVPDDAARLIRAGKRREALRSLSKCERTVRVLCAQGCLNAQLGRDGKARRCFAMALDKDKGCAAARDALIELSTRNGWWSGFIPGKRDE